MIDPLSELGKLHEAYSCLSARWQDNSLLSLVEYDERRDRFYFSPEFFDKYATLAGDRFLTAVRYYIEDLQNEIREESQFFSAFCYQRFVPV